jgi:Cys-rich four helix bundle protein (predicted Tat secretion target)
MIERRELLLAAAGATAGALAARAAVAAPPARWPTTPPDVSSGLGEAAAQCVRSGEICLQHCLDLLGTGDTSLAACARLVTQMLAVCTAVGPIAAANSRYMPITARLCLEVCTDCERECRKHAEHHAVCKACADACAAAVEAAKRVLA